MWLTSTQPEGAARFRAQTGTLADLVAAHPEVLGHWARQLFGDEMPLFAKFIHTDFPSRVHLGFRRAVRRDELLGWLEREQELLRILVGALRVPDAGAFAAYHSRYARWASDQALEGWRRDDDEAAATQLACFVDAALDLPGWLRAVRENRCAIVDTLNEVDLRRESGHLLLTAAGVLHGIFGLSHQTHPLDRTRVPLETLYRGLAERSLAGASDAELGRMIDQAGLGELRRENGAPPKNEAWLATDVDGAPVLFEPQQSSDTTYSVADFYTPLTWSTNGVRFRKGGAAHGLATRELSEILDHLDLGATSVEAVRRLPKAVPGASRDGAELFCLVDEPRAWPFFTTYQLELQGQFRASPPAGVFQELVVLRGRVELGDDDGARGELSPGAPAFIPATLDGPYSLSAHEPATVLILGVPGPRGGAPVVSTGRT
jgi:hypothetical protein